MAHLSWRPVPDFEGMYAVSSCGRVRSLAREVIQRGPHKVTRYIVQSRVMRSCVTSTGYRMVSLSRAGKVKMFYVHRLVAMAFIPNPENKPQVNHIDGDRQNNLVENLEWVDARGNYLHAVSLWGPRKSPNPSRGESHYRAKLTWPQVRAIRKMAASGKYTKTKIAAKFGITDANVYSIVVYKTWKDDQGQQGLTLPKVD